LGDGRNEGVDPPDATTKHHGAIPAVAAAAADPVAAIITASLKGESDLRRILLKYISSLVDADAPTDLKVFAIVVFASFGVMSIVVTVFGFHAVCGSRMGVPCNPYFYVAFIAVLFLPMLGFGIPLVRRAAQVEQAQRLKTSMANVKRARRGGDVPPALTVSAS
jgi:hypothetical protein